MHLPRKLGRYELLHELARGGMGVVYLGRIRSVGGFSRMVAIKTCLQQHVRDKAFVSMFLDEARIAARISHPNVVATLDVEQAEELFLAMEYIEGERLLDVGRAANAHGGIPLSIALRVLVDALNGLHAAHVQEDSDGTPLQIVHRDVSPHNVLVGSDGLSRIADFGVARAEKRISRTLVGGAPKGKLAYMSPEQLLELPMDARSDVFAAGIVAWEFLTGTRLFDGESETSIVAQIIEAPITPLTMRRADVPVALSDAVLKALQRRVQDRFQSAAEFADALEHCGVHVASHRAVAEYLQRTMGDRAAQRVALRRRLEAMAPVPDNEAPAVANTTPPVPAPAPIRTMFSSPGSPTPSVAPPSAVKTQALPLASIQPLSYAAHTQSPQLAYGSAQSPGAQRGPSMVTPVPARADLAANSQVNSVSSPLLWLAIAMTCAGVVFASVGFVRRVRPESTESARDIQIAAPVPLVSVQPSAQPFVNTNALQVGQTVVPIVGLAAQSVQAGVDAGFALLAGDPQRAPSPTDRGLLMGRRRELQSPAGPRTRAPDRGGAQQAGVRTSPQNSQRQPQPNAPAMVGWEN
jgi:serine/threonine-protein kinase